MQRLSSAHHPECRDQTYQTEAMIAVQVRDKHIVQPAGLQRHAPKPDLAALTAVDHKRLVTQLQHLAGR